MYTEWVCVPQKEHCYNESQDEVETCCWLLSPAPRAQWKQLVFFLVDLIVQLNVTWPWHGSDSTYRHLQVPSYVLLLLLLKANPGSQQTSPMTQLIPFLRTGTMFWRRGCAGRQFARPGLKTDAVVWWKVETGCGYGSTHRDWLSDKMHYFHAATAGTQWKKCVWERQTLGFMGWF